MDARDGSILAHSSPLLRREFGPSSFIGCENKPPLIGPNTHNHRRV